MSLSRGDCLKDMSCFRHVAWQKVPIFPMWVMGQDTVVTTDNAIYFKQRFCRLCLADVDGLPAYDCRCDTPPGPHPVPVVLHGPANVLMNVVGNLHALRAYGMHLAAMTDDSPERDILDKVIAAYGSLKASYQAAGIAFRSVCNEQDDDEDWPISMNDFGYKIRMMEETRSIRKFATLQCDLAAAQAAVGPKMTSQELLRRKIEALPPRDRSACVLRIHIEALATMTVENKDDVWLEHWPAGY